METTIEISIEDVIKNKVKELTGKFPHAITKVNFSELSELKERMSIKNFENIVFEKNNYVFVMTGKQINNVIFSEDERIDLCKFSEFGNAIAKLPGAAAKLEKGIIYIGMTALTLSFCMLAYYLIFI